MGQARAKEAPEREGLPWPNKAPARLLGMLHAWLKWRLGKTAPKPVTYPDPELRYKIMSGGRVVGTRGFILAPSTAPQDPGRNEEFNMAFWGLELADKGLLLFYLRLENDAWTENKNWQESLKWLGVTQGQFEQLLEAALLNLAAAARRRGLL